MSLNWQPLIDAAEAAQRNSYSPYSGFAVGAALLTADGSIIPGCNIENRSFGLTICAERTAVAAANAARHREFEALVVLAGSGPPVSPCGQCLDTLAEFNPEIPILLISNGGQQEEMLLSDLLPQPFSFPPHA